MSRNWRFFIPGYLLALPHTILLGLPFLLWYWPKSFHFIDGTLCFVIGRKHLLGGEWVGAQTHGLLKFFRDQEQLESDSLHVHENVHMAQAMVFGPFYPLSYGLHFLWLYAGPRIKRAPEVPTVSEAYRKILWEAQAYRIQKRFDEGLIPGAWGT